MCKKNIGKGRKGVRKRRLFETGPGAEKREAEDVAASATHKRNRNKRKTGLQNLIVLYAEEKGEN